MALIKKLENIGNAIREKTGKTDLLTLEQMVTEIEAIETGGGSAELPEEAYLITGDCASMFSNGKWAWYLDMYRDKVTTEEITKADNMFSGSEIEEIPFDLNFKGNSYENQNAIFQLCTKLKKISGKIVNMYPAQLQNFFNSDTLLQEIPEFVNLNMNRIYTYGYSNLSSIFTNCSSLRRIPEELLKQLYTPMATSHYYTVFYNGFYTCYALDELIGLNPQSGALTSNTFITTFNECRRLKEIIFATQEDGTPYEVQWKSQTIDLTKNVGHFNFTTNEWTESSINSGINSSNICTYNSGITKDKVIYDETTYAALKDDPDAFCMNNNTNKCAYSRYNHDSAVNTINSLPDTSAYLAANGGINTIKFLGAAGSATDGGAINTLTEEEIAVATAKGWTVTLV